MDQSFRHNFRKEVNLKNFLNLLFVLTLLVTAGCQAKDTNVQELVVTMQAQTAAPASPTPLPSDTPQPTATIANTATPVPPTATPVPTKTPRPTETRVPTPTPGPLVDDFTNESLAWADCDGCKIEDGRMLMGPFDPSSNFHYSVCETCETAAYFRTSADATYLEGQVDRTFGMVLTNDKYMVYVGISPYQAYEVSVYDWNTDQWKNLTFEWSSAVKGSFATNHIEFEVKPATKSGLADIYVKINGKVVYVLYGKEALPSLAGMGMAWHGMGAAYDNFTYEVIKE